MSDLIDRKLAKDAIHKKLDGASFDGDLWHVADDIDDILDELPSAEPRKKGKWIKLNNSCTIRCNQCGQKMTSLCDIQLPNYCPNCGSYNGGEEE